MIVFIFLILYNSCLHLHCFILIIYVSLLDIGKFLKVSNLSPYFDECGVKRVVVSAPVKEPECLNVVLGCNHNLLREEQKLVTNASCTTNCLAPVVRVMKENFGIKHGCITTIHNVTGTQVGRFILFISIHC